MIDRYVQVRSIQIVAREFGCSEQTVWHHTTKAGVQLGRGRRPYKQRLVSSYRKRTTNGYVHWVYRFWDSEGKVHRHQFAEHRVLMEQQLGRALDQNEHVHHKNGLRDDNRIENLEVVSPRRHPGGATHCPHCGGTL